MNQLICKEVLSQHHICTVHVMRSCLHWHVRNWSALLLSGNGKLERCEQMVLHSFHECRSVTVHRQVIWFFYIRKSGFQVSCKYDCNGSRGRQLLTFHKCFDEQHYVQVPGNVYSFCKHWKRVLHYSYLPIHLKKGSFKSASISTMNWKKSAW